MTLAEFASVALKAGIQNASAGLSAVASWLDPVQGPVYMGAGLGRRVGGFYAPTSGVNRALLGNITTLRARAHALMRSDTRTWRAVRAYIASLMGTGIMPEPRIQDRALRRELVKLWGDFMRESDADGRTDGYGQMIDAATDMVVVGEALARLRDRYVTDDLAVPLQIELYEADHLPHDLHRDLGNGRVIRAGVEHDALGARAAYHLYRVHPADDFALAGQSLETVRVPAENVLHVFRAVRRKQLRGEPRLARVLLAAYFLDRFDDATLEKASLAAHITGFIKRVTGLDLPPPTADADKKPDAQGAISQRIQPGHMAVLEDGEEVQFAPAAELGDYLEITEEQARKIAMGAGSLYEHTTGNYKGVTYSSLREARLQLRKECEQEIYHCFVPQWCQPLWNAFLDRAVLAGRISIGADEYLARRRELRRVRWITPRFDYVDPLKDATAEKELIKAGIMTVSEAIRGRGWDPEEVFEERRDELALLAELGIATDVDPGRGTSSISPTLDPNEPPADDEEPPVRRRSRRAA